jgi:WD40 repeat protein
MLAAGGLDGTGSVWSLDGSRAIGTPVEGHEDAVVAALATPDGSVLVTAGFDGRVIAHNIATHDDRWTTSVGAPIVSAVLDPRGTRVAVGTAGGQLRVLDITDGTASGTARFDGVVAGIAWSNVEPLLAVAVASDVDSSHGAVQFIDSTTLETVRESDDITGGTPIAVAFAPDGQRLAVVADNNVVRVIDVATGAIEPQFMESVDASFTSVAWSPRGDRIATGANGGTVQIWDATSLKRAAPPGRVDSIGVAGVAFSSDGALVASTSAFAVTQLWLADTGAPFGGPLVGGDPPIAIESLPPLDRPDIPFVPSFAPDGGTVYAGGDHPMQWSLEPTIWATAACAIAGRELTATEWARFLPTESQRPVCGV